MSKYPAEFETETHEKYHYKKRKHKVVRSICSLHTFSEFQAKTKYILFHFKCLEYHIYVVSMRIHESGIISTYIHSQEKIRFVHVLFVQKPICSKGFLSQGFILNPTITSRSIVRKCSTETLKFF